MTIVLDLPPATAAALERFCTRHGECAADVIADAVRLHIDACLADGPAGALCEALQAAREAT